MTTTLEQPTETKPRRTRAKIGPHDGQKALSQCLHTLDSLSNEWREWVITCIVNCPTPAVQKELPFVDDTEPTELYDEKDDQ